MYRYCVPLLTFIALVVVLPAQGQPSGSANAALQYWQAIALLPADADTGRYLQMQGDDPNAKATAGSLDSSLQYLHRGAVMPAIDWGLAYEEGFDCKMPHLSKMRMLASAGVLAARVDFTQGQAARAIEELKDVVALSQHVAAGDQLIISVMVAINIRQLAINELARAHSEYDAGHAPPPVGLGRRGTAFRVRCAIAAN